MQAAIDASLAAYTGKPVSNVLFNLGSNDAAGIPTNPTQAEWEADIGYILDAMRVKWPSVKVYMMRPWRRNYNANCDTMAGWIDNVISTRATWAILGPDERVFLENGDNGVTYTVEGVHPNPAGYALTAAQWQTALGY